MSGPKLMASRRRANAKLATEPFEMAVGPMRRQWACAPHAGHVQSYLTAHALICAARYKGERHKKRWCPFDLVLDRASALCGPLGSPSPEAVALVIYNASIPGNRDPKIRNGHGDSHDTSRHHHSRRERPCGRVDRSGDSPSKRR